MVESVLKNHAPFKRYPKKSRLTKNLIMMQYNTIFLLLNFCEGRFLRFTVYKTMRHTLKKV